MKIAVAAVTKQGVEMAERTALMLSESGDHETVLYLPGKFSLLQIDGQRRLYRKPLREVLGGIFGEYDGIVCVMALGIVVRLIAPYLKDKTTDPAVVVIDEAGRNVISVLSGHWGGANALTVQIAGGLGANPVITTATDVRGLPAIEMLAKEHNLVIEPFELVKKVNAAIVNGSEIVIYSETPLDIVQTENIKLKDFAGYSSARREKGRVVLVTNRTARSFPPGTLFLRPKNLCIGVGCRRGVTGQEVKDAIRDALEQSGRAVSSVQSLASIDIKSNEAGLLEAAGDYNFPVKFFTKKAILAVQTTRGNELGFSQMVNEKIGVGGVCESAAILGAGEKSGLVMPKTKYGKVTIAIAEGSSL
ncbi:MAG: cobalt-precorrin 5A hydrolase [Eubacteriales bacterium]